MMKMQVIRMLLAIVVVFFLCWGPKCVLNVLKRHQLKILHVDSAFYVMVRQILHEQGTCLIQQCT